MTEARPESSDLHFQVLLHEIQTIQRENDKNAERINTQYQVISKWLEEQDKAWSMQWRDVNKRIDDIEVRFSTMKNLGAMWRQ